MTGAELPLVVVDPGQAVLVVGHGSIDDALLEKTLGAKQIVKLSLAGEKEKVVQRQITWVADRDSLHGGVARPPKSTDGVSYHYERNEPLI